MNSDKPKPWLKFYDKGVPNTIEVPNITIYEKFAEVAQSNVAKTAIIFFGSKITYAALGSLINQYALVFRRLDLKKGDLIALFLPNCPQFIISFFAAQQIGAIVTAFNPTYKEEELAEVLNDSTAKVIITLNKFVKTAESAIKHMDGMPAPIILFTDISEFFPLPLKWFFRLFKAKKDGHFLPDCLNHRKDIISLPNFLGKLSCKERSIPINLQTKPADVALLQYTGGTTGRSKGAMLTHQNILADLAMIRSWMIDFKDGEEVLLGVLPFFHIYGMSTVMLLGLLTGSRIILLPKFEAKETIKAIKKYSVTIFNGVPPMYAKITGLAAGKSREYFRSLKLCLSGAMKLDETIQKQFEELTGAKVVEGFGLSEASPVTHINPFYGKRKMGSFGIPVPSTDVRVLEVQFNKDKPGPELPPGEIGRMAIKGPQIMRGYWNQPEETGKIFHQDYLLTSDLVYADEDGFFFYVDRLGDMMNIGGLKVYSSQIEKILFLHPKIKDAMVVSARDRQMGERIVAFVALKDEFSQEPEEDIRREIISYCRNRLAIYKVPREIKFKKELPRSIIGKAIKRKL